MDWLSVFTLAGAPRGQGPKAVGSLRPECRNRFECAQDLGMLPLRLLQYRNRM